MAFISISATENLSEVARLAGANMSEDLSQRNFYYSNGVLYVDDISQEALDEALEKYNSAEQIEYRLNNVKSNKKAAISQQAADYIETKYPSFRQQMFQALYSEAKADGLTDRVAYIAQLLDWVKTVTTLAILSEETVQQAESEETVNAISVDFTQFDITDPSITIKEALSL